MPTVGERLATLEGLARENRASIEEVRDLISGGGDIGWERSVRGRLHKIEGTLAGIVLRRSFGAGLLKRWERAVLVGCAAATVAASWYAAIAH